MENSIELDERVSPEATKRQPKASSKKKKPAEIEIPVPPEIKASPYDPLISRKLMERLTGLSAPTLIKYEQDNVVRPSRTKFRGLEQLNFRVSDVQAALRKRGVKFKHKQEAEVISVFSQKGGVGKSAFTQHLASMLSLVGKVLVIDLDAQSDATTLFGISPNYTDVIDEDAKLEPTIAELINWDIEGDLESGYERRPFDEVVKRVTDSLHVIPSDLDLGEINYALNTYPFRPKIMPDGAELPGKLFRIREVIEEIKAERDYDYIVFDCPPNIEILNLNALISSNRIIIPLELEAKSLNIMRRNRSWLQKIASYGEDLGFSWDKILIVPNKFQKANIKLKALAKLQDIYATDQYLTLSDLVVPNATVVDQSQALREPVFAMAMKNAKDLKADVRRAKQFTNIFWVMLHELLDLEIDRVIFEDAEGED